MAKYLLTEKNIAIDNSYKNVPYFKNEAARDTWVNDNLFGGKDYKTLMNALPRNGIMKTTPLTYDVSGIASDVSIYDKNFIIIQFGNKYDFCFINRIENTGNNNIFDLSLESHPFFSYLNVIPDLKNMFISKGHSDVRNYLENTYEITSKVIGSISKLKKNKQNEIYDVLNDNAWLVLFQKIQDKEKGLLKIIKGENYLETFKCYIAPLKPIQDANAGSTSTNIFDKDISGGSIRFDYEFNSNVVLTRNITFYNPAESITNWKVYQDIPNDKAEYRVTRILDTYLPIEGEEKKLIFFKASEEQNDSFTLNEWFSKSNIENLDLNTPFPGSINLEVSGQKRYVDIYWIRCINSTTYELSTPMFNDIARLLPNCYYKTSFVSPSYFYGNYNIDHLYGTSEQGYTAIDYVYNIKEGIWDSTNLSRFLNSTKDGTIMTGKKTNFNPLITNQTTGVFNSNNVENVIVDTIDIKNTENEIIESYNIYRLSFINYDTSLVINQYKGVFGSYNELGEFIKLPFLERIEGLFPYEIIYENNKNILIDPNAIEDDGTLILEHYSSFTPEWEETLKFVSSRAIDYKNENNTWSNDKEFTMGSNTWDTYKTSNPASSKLGPLQDISKVVTGGVKGGIVSKGPKGAIAGAGAGAIGAVGNVIGRQDMKRQPQGVSGSGDALGDSIFNYIGDRFGLIKYNFIGPTKDFILENIKRDGVTYNTGLYVKEYADIERPVWNYITLDNFSEANNHALSNEVETLFAQIFENGVRIWNDTSNILNFDLDNGDDIVETN